VSPGARCITPARYAAIMRLGIIGGGNMGQAIVRGAVRAKVLAPAEIIVAEIDSSRHAALRETGCQVTDDPVRAAAAEQVMLAVKPQAFPVLARQLAPVIGSRIVISIMAGLQSSRLRHALGDQVHVIRVMPNTPSQIGAGVSAIALGAGARTGDEQLAVAVFGAVGITVMLDEQHLHAVTAVSGSGPAYIFLLAEAMEAAARSLGLSAEVARVLVKQTVMGAGRLLSESPTSAMELRRAVTSPGGTTEAALRVFEQRGFQEMVIAALTAARDRGVALDQPVSSNSSH
jgi:pyrroline-5-carboxylate reductase